MSHPVGISHWFSIILEIKSKLLAGAWIRPHPLVPLILCPTSLPHALTFQPQDTCWLPPWEGGLYLWFPLPGMLVNKILYTAHHSSLCSNVTFSQTPNQKVLPPSLSSSLLYFIFFRALNIWYRIISLFVNSIEQQPCHFFFLEMV